MLCEANEGSSSLDIFAIPVDDAEIQTSIKNAGDRIEEVERIVRDTANRSAAANAESMSEDDIAQDEGKLLGNSETLRKQQLGHDSDSPVKNVGTSLKDNIVNAENASFVDERKLLSKPVNETLNINGEKGKVMKT